jgi:Cu/Ag efflux protein CusF
MICRRMGYMGLAAAVVLGLVLAAGPVLAQVSPSIPGAPPAPSGAAPAAKAPAERTTTGMLEGSVKKVDPGSGELQVSSGPLGVFHKTLEVSNSTDIQMNGQRGTLADLREGEKIKASYESRDGKNFATRIEVAPEAKEPRGAAQPMELPRPTQKKSY